MKHELILFVLAILIPACAFCQIDNPDSIKSIPGTGDIMVVARGCGLPPYEFGLRLELNRMNVVIPEWIRETPISSLKDQHWIDSALEILGNNGAIIINHIYDSLRIKMHLVNNLYIYSNDNYGIGITDSLGRYIFRNIPAGCYQMVVEDHIGQSLEKSLSDSMYASRDDFPMFTPYTPDQEKYLRTHLRKYMHEIPSDVIWSSLLDCDQGVIDYVYVIPDSVSVVHIAIQIHDNLDPYINISKVWEKKMKARDGQNESKKEE